MSKVTLQELRAEMARLTEVMMARNALYLKREAEIVEEFGKDPLKLSARLNDDITLLNASAVAKTCATLAGGMAAVIQAELAYEARYRHGRYGEKNVQAVSDVVQQQLDAPRAVVRGPGMEKPISIRPQDLAPHARMIVFGERGMQA